MKNNQSQGASTPTTVNGCALNRGSGYKKTMGACESKTGSRHKGTDMNNKWTKVPGSGTGGNVKGYGD